MDQGTQLCEPGGRVDPRCRSGRARRASGSDGPKRTALVTIKEIPRDKKQTGSLHFINTNGLKCLIKRVKMILNFIHKDENELKKCDHSGDRTPNLPVQITVSFLLATLA